MMTAARVMGLETEYAAIWQGDGNPPARPDIFAALAKGVLARYGVGLEPGSSLFMPNGGRLYFDDEGHHPGAGLVEWATPECSTALEATLYDLAGQRLLAEALPATEETLGGRLTLLKNNDDGRGHTYGCHENYLVARANPHLPDETSFFHYLVRCLTPFLVTRQILCGAGKIGWYGHAVQPKAGYQVSQRADHIAGVVSEDARRYRPIINTRDEPHADPRRWRRLHILVGDSNMSAWCTFIKLGTTRLVLDMAEQLAMDAAWVLVNPVHALRSVSYNGIHVPVCLREGGIEIEREAVAIQRSYLDLVKQTRKGSLDPETALIIKEWEEALDCLTWRPENLGDRSDWIAKLLVVEDERAARFDLDWDDPLLLELDLRYHDINPQRGLFEHLLAQRVIYYGEDVAAGLSEAAVSRAMELPPQGTRAQGRGAFVAWCWKQGRLPQADWTSVVLADQEISLADPLVNHAETISRAIAEVTKAQAL